MTPYKLAKLLEGHGRAELPQIEERAGAVAAYRKVLNKLLQEMAAETRNSVLREIRRERGLTVDAANESWFRALREARRRLVAEATALVGNILRLEASRHTETFRSDVNRVLGIDLRAVIREEDITDEVATALARNAALIRDLGNDVQKRVEQVVYAATANGTSLKDVSKELTKQFGFTKRRANLIARDQVSKLTSDLNRTRQQQAGVTKYVWRTSQDERVRPRHRKLDGTEYKWGSRTGAEQGLPPGQPIQCRCVAKAVIEW